MPWLKLEKLPIIFVILNDKCYGMVKHRHRQTGKEPLEFTLPTVDFSLMAKAMGANSYIIRHAQDLENLPVTLGENFVEKNKG